MTKTEMTSPPFTLERFVQLPALLPAGVFLAWSGLTWSDLKEYEMRINDKRKFAKRDLAQLCGFPYADGECAELRLHQARRLASNMQRIYLVGDHAPIDTLRLRLRELVEVLG